MFTIAPARRRSILRETARQVRKAPRRFVSITCAQSSSVMRAMSVSRVMPALLTRTSISPRSRSTVSTSPATSAASATSAATVIPPTSPATSSAASLPAR
jgi:hypothetical protein